MRKTYRDSSVKDYWCSRWDDVPADQPMANDQVYPLKYAKQIINDKKGRILEAGCGVGRLVRYFHNDGFDILAVEPNIKKYPEFEIVEYQDAIKRSDIISLFVAHREFLDLNIETQLNFCGI